MISPKNKSECYHPNSFIEDPTRIFRAIRFASRLGFELGEQTQFYLQNAIASGIYHQNSGQNNRPALQSRLRNELKYIFQESNWQRALSLIQHTDALICLHPGSTFDGQELKNKLRSQCSWQASLPSHRDEVIPRWLMVVQVLLAQLPSEARSQIAGQLNLPEKVQDRLQKFETAFQSCQSQLNQRLKPSQVVQTVKRMDDELVILCAAKKFCDGSRSVVALSHNLENDCTSPQRQ